MAQNLSGYHRALDLFEGLVAGVSRDGWDASSPCAGWTARDVAGHVTGGQHLVRALASGEPVPDVSRDPSRFVQEDVLMSWRTARKECAEALTQDALDGLIPFGALGLLPLADYLEAYILEPLVHAWDLAQATGQPSRLDPDLVHHAFATAQVVSAPLRAKGHLAPPLTPPRGATEQTRLLAFLGRAVA
ncbi:TIGR03086 family protein [Actinomadura sp. KC06]|uniref:TIGR03086 family metal-binding protein n=1 Tax=Actinomadura sp. KC06 TaxID=2530369 RepID=UPI00104562D8|nr:TIGR03086 family metal-binding protein [Actinomadura sp. KC06]TDD32361.1 TIGR03086 family protein [Actinomadura sp. KC06]